MIYNISVKRNYSYLLALTVQRKESVASGCIALQMLRESVVYHAQSIATLQNFVLLNTTHGKDIIRCPFF